MKRNIRSDKLAFHLNIDVDKFYETFTFAQSLKFKYISKNVTFLDEYKTKHEGKLSSAQKGQHCYWDRNPFTWEGIHCPLRKEYPPLLKKYNSNINDNEYIIQDSINSKTGYYLTVDYFCSGECCMAYIEEHNNDPRFIDAKELLCEMLGRAVKPAGSYRLLKEYGGNMSIEEFRKSYCNKLFSLEAMIFQPTFFIYKESYHF